MRIWVKERILIIKPAALSLISTEKDDHLGKSGTVSRLRPCARLSKVQ